MTMPNPPAQPQSPAHHRVALTPPMGWNSWDCYGASVTEQEVLGNAQYLAEHLKPYGWEYVVVDIQWYEPDANSSVYRPFVPLEMDAHSRLMPSARRFPSAANGAGFKPLADEVHRLGLKFGIHIMRGIPRQAVHANTPILGTRVHARDIAHPNSICPWNTDKYGVDATREGAQAYYNSLFALYAEWGVDFVKVDDIAASRLYHFHPAEIQLIRRAIDGCGRDMVEARGFLARRDDEDAGMRVARARVAEYAAPAVSVSCLECWSALEYVTRF